MNESERQELDYLREHHEQTHHAAAKYELLVDYLRGESVAIPPSCSVFSEIERLRARVAELEKPYAYWSKLDPEWTHRDPDDFVRNTDVQPGRAIEFVPIHKLPRVWYGTVPDKRAEWADGAWWGDCELIGPYASADEAKAEAQRVIEARLAEMGSAEQNEQGENQ